MYVVRITRLIFLISFTTMAQELPFSSIQPPAELYSAGTSISRMIQGLGFRYYWATDGLRDEDLSYRPTSEAKNTMETIQPVSYTHLTLPTTPYV